MIESAAVFALNTGRLSAGDRVVITAGRRDRRLSEGPRTVTGSRTGAGQGGTMGFFRTQQERFAVRLLAWRYQRLGAAVPDPAELQRQARRIVDDAHRIARERGRNVTAIVKETVENLKNN